MLPPRWGGRQGLACGGWLRATSGRAALGFGARTAATGEGCYPARRTLNWKPQEGFQSFPRSGFAGPSPAAPTRDFGRRAPMSLSGVAWHPAADGRSSSTRRRSGHILPPARRPIPGGAESFPAKSAATLGTAVRGSSRPIQDHATHRGHPSPPAADASSARGATGSASEAGSARVDSRTERPRSVANESGPGPATSFPEAGRVRPQKPSVPWPRAARPLACGRRGSLPGKPRGSRAPLSRMPSAALPGRRASVTLPAGRNRRCASSRRPWSGWRAPAGPLARCDPP